MDIVSPMPVDDDGFELHPRMTLYVILSCLTFLTPGTGGVPTVVFGLTLLTVSVLARTEPAPARPVVS